MKLKIWAALFHRTFPEYMKFHHKVEFGWRLKKLTGALISSRLTAECAEKSKYALRTSAVYSIISTAVGVLQHVHHCPRLPLVYRTTGRRL